ncbi:unnamed protein product [Adineta steineri]|uniref:Uncharacterized protein n=1 Tax=Adineta steineri TaxID=433720 RepID=A0A814G8T9_9BILA|nr:unnamed protein product [Adineta steineri]CAF0991588.1 unnamed protein product [Adineta steineri]
MSCYQSILFTVLILLLSCGYVMNLICYSCNGCNDPFKSTGIAQINSTMNGSQFYCMKTKGAGIVDRNITDNCQPFTAVGNGVHCCQTDLCNGSNQILSINSLSIVLIIGIIGKLI